MSSTVMVGNSLASWNDLTGDGDDALARFIETLVEADQVSPLGSVVSYNNAAVSLAGRIIEKVTGQTYEQAIKELVFEPLGLDHCFFFPNEIMTRRFVVGHNQHPDGRITIARVWAMPRSGNPAGGISSNAADQIAWARFHLGDGRAPGGKRVLSERLLRQMQEATAESRGSALGDAIGISWMLRDVDGVRVVSHGGDTIGQHASFDMVPERDFAVVGLTNCGPNGSQFLDELGRWALETYIGVVDRAPEPVPMSPEELEPYEGTYETIAVTCEVSAHDGGLRLEAAVKPGMLEQLLAAGEEEPPDMPPLPLGLLPGAGDRYVVTDGPAKGMTGYFARGADGAVEGIHVGGRLASRA